MKNYERYNKVSRHTYNNKPWLSLYFMRLPGDKVILPYIEAISSKQILEVGPGTGDYTKIFLENNCSVTGVDINPHLGEHLNIEVIKAKADDFSRLVTGGPFEVAASFWMTEYLSPAELTAFFTESGTVLGSKGEFVTTIIADKGWGKLYTSLAGLKGIKKYGYSPADLGPMLDKSGFTSYDIIPIYGRLGFIFAYFIVAAK